jgi:hypothetical protein
VGDWNSQGGLDLVDLGLQAPEQLITRALVDLKAAATVLELLLFICDSLLDDLLASLLGELALELQEPLSQVDASKVKESKLSTISP